MANDISAVCDILITEAGAVLREMATTARRVTTEWADEAAQPNAKITIPIASPKTATQITDPRAPFAARQPVKPRGVDVTLDRWWGVNFELSDKEMMEIKPGIFPKEAEEALRALVNYVDVDILKTALKSPYYEIFDGSAPATTIWPSVTKLHKVLFDNKCPIVPGDISVFVNGSMQAAMLQAPEFYRYDVIGESQGLKDASLGRRLNLDFFANQNLPTHTAGAAVTGWTIAGATSEGWTGSVVAPNMKTEQALAYNGTVADPGVGDIINIVGSGDHAVVSVVAGSNTMVVRPSLRGNVADTAVISYSQKSSEPDVGDTYSMGYAFHRGAIAFASRPLSSISSPSSIIRATADPLSGIAVRLEQVRVGKANEWQWDILYGVQLVREELTSRWISMA